MAACAAGLLALFPTWAGAATTERINVSSGGVEAEGRIGSLEGLGTAISADGRYVAFASYAYNLVAGDTNNAADVFRRDRLTGETIRVSVSSAEAQGNRGSGIGVDVSADGNLIVFGSKASNLVPRDTNRVADVFVRNGRPGRRRG